VLGELRGTFGVQVAKIAAAFKLDVEGGLASILPANAEADVGDDVRLLRRHQHPRRVAAGTPRGQPSRCGVNLLKAKDRGGNGVRQSPGSCPSCSRNSEIAKVRVFAPKPKEQPAAPAKTEQESSRVLRGARKRDSHCRSLVDRRRRITRDSTPRHLRT